MCREQGRGGDGPAGGERSLPGLPLAVRSPTWLDAWGRWLLPQWAVAPARCLWLSGELALYGRHCGGGASRDVKFEKKADAGLGTRWV